jgi:hypothetical protein
MTPSEILVTVKNAIAEDLLKSGPNSLKEKTPACRHPSGRGSG